jgi:hypothetical protein
MNKKHFLWTACWILSFVCSFQAISQSSADPVKLGKEKVFFSIDMPRGVLILYFDRGSWNIPEVEAKYLDRVLNFMKANPDIALNLESHTDTRGKEDYNLELSKRRVNTVSAYFVQKGIDIARIKARSFGEQKLLNRCRNGVKCSEEEHRQNRRIECSISGTSTEWFTLLKSLKAEKTHPNDKSKTPRPIQMPEANNSVPLPVLKPSNKGSSV